MAKLINLLLKKSDPDFPWGFSLGTLPPALHSLQITWVENGSLASQHLELGDRVLEIEGIDTTMLSNTEVESMLNTPSRKLELLIMKKYAKPVKPISKDEIIQTENIINEKIGTTGKFEERKSEFWTSVPTDLKTIKKETEWTSCNENFEVMTQSTIFTNLNKQMAEKRKIDPREEKRKFWENCRKGDSVRRFKWGDSVKPKRVDSPSSRSEGNCSYTFKETLKQTRSKSCEPTSSHNPFLRPSISPSNPFYSEYEKAMKFYPLPEIKIDDFSKIQENTFQTINTKNINKSQESLVTQNKTSEILTSFRPKIERSRTVPEIPRRLTKSISKEDFSNKCEFFEKATSPITSLNEKAKDLVEERLKCTPEKREDKPSKPLIENEKIDAQKHEENTFPIYKPRIIENHFSSNLKKPSDFINLVRLPEKQAVQEIENKKQTCTSLSHDHVGSYNKNEYIEEDIQICVKEKPNTGLYENFEELYKSCRERAKAQIIPEDFEEIRDRLGKLLGGVPTRPVTHLDLREERMEEAIEEAFQKLAREEGLEEAYEYYERQSNQIAANNGHSGGNVGGPAPPPPPPMHGKIPSVRIASEIPQRSHEPPAAIQVAMMTKDKKPFTYTPGGLDLAEIRSPRMARRINRNAHIEDSCTAANQPRPAGPPQPLPPSALAAMQPQIAIPVFPPGGNNGHHGHHTPTSPISPPPPPPPMTSSAPPSGFPYPPPLNSPTGAFPPPPPSQETTYYPESPTSGQFPPPPPPPMPIDSMNANFQKMGVSENGQAPFLADISNHPPLRSVAAPQQRPPADFVAEIPCHAPLKPINHPPRSSYDPSNTSQIQVQLKPVSPKPAQVQNSSPSYVPPQPQLNKPIEPQVQKQPPPRPAPELYIPPPQQSTPVRQTPPTPNLNKSPAPWMKSRQTSQEAQPPWTVKKDEPQQNSASPVTRVIPIQFEGENQPQQQQQHLQQQQHQQQQQYQSQPNYYQAPYSAPAQNQQNFQGQQIYYPPQNYVQPPFIPQNNAQEQVRTRIIPIQIEGSENQKTNQNRFQNSPQPDYQRNNSVDGARQLQSQNSWSQATNNPIQSRSFRVLQKITGSDEQPSGPMQQENAGETFLVNRVYPQQATGQVGADNMWDPNTPIPFCPNPNYLYYPPQTPEEQQKFWEHYNAMCAYMAQMNAAACRYSPYPLYPYPYSETDDYSSSDEMTYYGKIFKKQQMAYEAQNQKNNEVKEESSGSDTEVEESGFNPLKSIKSVPNINVFNESDSESESETESEDMKLSDIMEETEPSGEDVKANYESDSSGSTLTLNEENAVTVRLPLQFSISYDNNEEVATVIVGNSEVSQEPPPVQVQEEPESLIITNIVREDSDPDVTATICLKKFRKEPEENEVTLCLKMTNDEDSGSEPDDNEKVTEDDLKMEESDCHWEDDSSSTSVQTVKKGSESETQEGTADEIDDIQAQRETSSSESETESEEEEEEEEEEESESESSESEEDEQTVAKEETCEAKTVSAEESEDDSGVTSDLSRHISETDTDQECGELRKMTRYQRAATHSRLFKLLQEECGDAEEEPISAKKERLTLPLNDKFSEDSLSSSSGINSPSSPNDKLVKELVKSLLSRKKGRHFRKLPLEKLHAAALRILQEDMDPYESSTSDESFLSPVGNPSQGTNDIPNPEQYGCNYSDYCNYYNSWGTTDCDYDIVPSKTFKTLRETTHDPFKGVSVRCPRVSQDSNNQSPDTETGAKET